MSSTPTDDDSQCSSGLAGESQNNAAVVQHCPLSSLLDDAARRSPRLDACASQEDDGDADTPAATTSVSTPVHHLCIKSSSKSAMDAASRRRHLERALHDVTSLNISIRKAAIRYGLSKSSLCDFVRKNGITIPNRRGRRSANFVSAPPTVSDLNGADDVVEGDEEANNEGASITNLEGRSFLSNKRLPSADDADLPSPKRTAVAMTLPLASPPSRRGGGRGRRARGAVMSNRGGTLRPIAPKSILRESPWNSVGFPTQVAMSSWGTTTVLPILANSNSSTIDNSSFGRSCNSPDHILLPPPSLPPALSPLSTGDDDSKFENKIKTEASHLNMSSEVPASTYAEGLMRFVDSSPSPYHAVNSVRQRLVANAFTELSDQDPWQIQPGKRYFVTKNQSTVLAFAVGGRWQPGNGFTMLGAHTDSPCLKVKPVSDRCASGYVQLGVETYGGGIWYTWFDRDLTVAGRVIVRTEAGLQHRLVHVKRPIARVPSLCIHLNRTVNDNFQVNKEQHMSPVLCTVETEKALGLRKDNDNSSGSPGKHPPSLLELVAKELGVTAADIVDLELCLADTQPTSRVGLHSEFICGPRMDNLFNAFAATEALVQSLPTLDEDPNVRVACLYDNEEVGSESAQGAASAFTEHILRRLSHSPSEGSAFEMAVARSYMLSADQGHAVHPNYDDKHERSHRPMFNKGMILKINANQRYASTAITAAIVKEVARLASVPLQEFVVRQDMACGSTIGPIQSARLGVATMDVGGPTLSMHSCREMVCAKSIDHAVNLYTAFFQRFPALADGFHVKHD